MSYTHLTIEERIVIYQLKKENKSMSYIAEAIGRSKSTICRELKRNNCGKKYKYLPHIAQRKYIGRKICCKKMTDINPMLVKYIEEKIKLTWSPEQIANRKNIEFKLLSFSTIYRWIHRGNIVKGDMKQLRRKGKFKRPQETKGRFNIGKSIKKRPSEVYKRNTFGHWEADTVESGRLDHKRKSKYCFVTLAERKSRKYIAQQQL
jgi:IS30 family transposase